MHILHAFFLAAALLFATGPARADSDSTIVAAPIGDSLGTVLTARLHDLLQDELFERTQVGLYVYDLTTDTPLFRHNERQLMRPASCQKLVTSVAALALLGTDYNYETTLHQDGGVSDGTLHGNLYVRGGFDPRFGRDDLQAFLQAVAEQGIDSIAGDVVLDLSFKDSTRLGWGWCWDDEATPLTPLLYRGRDDFANAFAAALAERGIRLGGHLRRGTLAGQTELLITRTHTIDQILLPLLRESNNLYAESLFYQIGAKSGRAYADRRQAEQAILRFIDGLGLRSSDYQVADGSGLSLYNYATAELLVSLLRHAYIHEEIYLHLHPALPEAGNNGTLRRRMRGTTASGNVFAKTGTVEGVSTLAGYCTAANGHLLAFAILNNGLRTTSTGRRFQDRVCIALTQAADAPTPTPETIPTDETDEAASEETDTQASNSSVEMTKSTEN